MPGVFSHLKSFDLQKELLNLRVKDGNTSHNMVTPLDPSKRQQECLIMSNASMEELSNQLQGMFQCYCMLNESIRASESDRVLVKTTRLRWAWQRKVRALIYIVGGQNGKTKTSILGKPHI